MDIGSQIWLRLKFWTSDIFPLRLQAVGIAVRLAMDTVPPPLSPTGFFATCVVGLASHLPNADALVVGNPELKTSLSWRYGTEHVWLGCLNELGPTTTLGEIHDAHLQYLALFRRIRWNGLTLKIC